MKVSLFLFFFLLTLFLYSCQKNPVDNVPPVVKTDGHITDSIKSTNDSIHLTGSATDADGQVIAYLWSLVSGPNLPVILSTGIAQTNLTGLVAGTYIFQLTATDNEGLTGVAFDTVTLTMEQPVMIALRNASNTNNEMIIAGNTTDDYSDGGGIELVAQNWTQYGLVDLTKGAFKFDLSAIPAATVIKSASLTLYSNPTPHNGNLTDANYGPHNAIFIERITTSWSNTTTTWQNQPATDETDHISIPQSNIAREDLVDVDVTSLVQKMISGTNYGFEIRMQSSDMYNCRIFCSSRYADSTKHPVLKVTY